MGLPLLGIANLGLGLFGALSGNSAQKKALKEQRAINAQQLAIQQEQLQLQKDMQRQGLATQVDANGNMTFYDNASNTWKTVLTPSQKATLDASNYEQQQQYTVDAPLARAESLVNARRRAMEGGTADAMLARVNDMAAGKGGLYDPAQMESMLRLGRESAINKSFDDISSAAMTQSARSGVTSAGDMLGNLARQRAKARMEMMGNPAIEGIQMAESLNAGKRADAINNYSTIASRATNSGGYNFNPSTISSDLSGNLARSRAAALQGQGAAAGALNGAAQTGANIKPVMGNTGSSMATGLMDLLNTTDWAGIGKGLFGSRNSASKPISAGPF